MKKSYPSSDDLASEARELLQEDWQANQENYRQAHEDLEFLAGDQWPSDVARERETNSRPTLTINRLPQFINQVVNDFRINSPSIRVAPVDNKGDPELADIYNGLLRSIMYTSSAHSVWSSAFAHAVSCGIGHYRVVSEYSGDDGFDQELKIKRISNPLSVYWDAASYEPDRSDANRCFVTELLPKKVFRQRYPGASEVDFIKPDSHHNSGNSFFWHDTDSVRVAEYWRKVYEKRKIALFADGQKADITDLKQNDLQFLPEIVAERTIEDHRIEQCLVSGSETLEKITVWPGKHIPIIPVLGQEVPLGEHIYRYGLIRYARDAQQLYNYYRSAAAETIALAPRAPFLATPQMIGEFKNQWDSHHLKNRPYLLYNPDPDAPGGRPIREKPADIPAALYQEAQIASDDMKATTGIYDASLGQRSNEQSGKAIMARQREGDVSTYHFRDNFNTSLLQCGRVLVDLIPKIYDTERVVALMEEESDEPKFAPINQQVMSNDGNPVLRNDLKAGKFDVRVNLGPSYTTRRQEAADSMIQFVQAFPQTAQVAGDLVAKAMDWPDADKFAERMRKTMPPQILGDDAEQPDPQAQEQAAKQQQMAELAMQLDLAQKQAEVEKTRAEVISERASAQEDMADTVEKQVEALVKAMQAGLPVPQYELQ